MAEDKPPRYYRTDKRGKNAYWAPGKFAEKYGFQKSHPLGPAGAEAKAAALKWNQKLDEARKGAPKPARYPKGSLGAFYEFFRGTESWSQMEPRTREDYERAWPTIEARFGDVVVSKISAVDSEAFHVDVHPAHTPNKKRDPKGKKKLPWNTAHRVLKSWRALLNALVAYGLVPAPAPVGRVSNPEPPAREHVWLHEEVMQLAETACWGGQLGIAIAIRIAWDAMLSPEDAWALPRAGWRYSGAGGEIDTARAKTDKAVLHAVNDDTAALVEAYIAHLEAAGVELPDDAPLVRVRAQRGHKAVWGPFRDKDHFGKAFRRVRAAAFPGDTRQFLDLRRSAMTEARLGGATKDDLGTAAANQVDKSEKLAATYLRAASRNVLGARERGRKPMADKFG